MPSAAGWSMRRRRRPLLVVVLASIAVNAALGIYALLVPHFGDLQGRVLTTSACVTGACVLAFACLPAWERGRLAFVPAAGIATSTLGFAVVVAGIWAKTESGPYWKAAATVLVVAGVCVLSSVLSLAELAPRFRWAFPAAVSLAALLGAMIMAGFWGEWSNEWYFRLLGVAAVLLAAATLAVPILHRASRGEFEMLAPGRASVRFCPSCGRAVLPVSDEEATCGGCGSHFRVRYLRSERPDPSGGA